MGILSGVCAALEAAHRRGLIHRDLKPENVFLVAGEAPEVTKVLDFGLAKFLPGPDSESTAATSPGVLVGTLHYMPPEQLRGEAVQASWDLWALAVMTYEMLAGAPPFELTAAAQWHGAVLAGRFTPLARHLPQAPESWQKFFDRAMALEQQRRPDSARVFLTALEAALA